MPPDGLLAPLAFLRPENLWLGLGALLLFLPYLRAPRPRMLALGPRLLAWSALVLAAAGLSTTAPAENEARCAVLAADLSESVRVDPEALARRDRLAASLATALGPADSLAAVAFGVQASLVSTAQSPPRAPDFGAADASVDPSATAMAAGIESALGACPPESDRRVVLLSDGHQTVGDARRAARLAREMGVPVFPVTADGDAVGGLSFAKVQAPPLVREGRVFSLRLLVRSPFDEARSAEVEVQADEHEALRIPIRLDPGLNLLEVPNQIDATGAHRLRARLFDADGELRDEGQVAITVTGPLRVLVVSEAVDSPVARVLEHKRVEVGRVTPEAIPELRELLSWHAVVLDDVPRRRLPVPVLDRLERYVRELGGSLAMTGGPRSFGDRGFLRTSLARLLPLTLVPHRPPAKGRLPIGVFLLVDRSNSMGYNSRDRQLRDGEKMRYAKQAASILVEQLRDDDRVGVIAFDSDPYVLGELRALSEHRTKLQSRIARLLPGGGTDFKEALEIAGGQLASTRLRVRHLILLTDGDTNRGGRDHDEILASLKRLQISVTTIRIGEDDVNLDMLRDFSEQTGGRFYHIRDLEQLPQLLIQDAREAEKKQRDRARQEERRRGYPVVEATGSPVLRGFDVESMPLVKHPVPSRPKAGAEVSLEVDGEGRTPLLATWQYGLGRVAALPLDPSASASAHWIRWEGYGKLWSQLLRWLARDDSPWEARTLVRAEGAGLALEVQTFEDGLEGDLEARLEAVDGDAVAIELRLAPVAARRFRASLPPVEAGSYTLVLTRRVGDEVRSQKREEIEIGSPVLAAGSERVGLPPDRELLAEIAELSGGALDAPLEAMLQGRPSTRLDYAPLAPWLLGVAMLCFLSDVAIRTRQTWA